MEQELAATKLSTSELQMQAASPAPELIDAPYSLSAVTGAVAERFLAQQEQASAEAARLLTRVELRATQVHPPSSAACAAYGAVDGT